MEGVDYNTCPVANLDPGVDSKGYQMHFSGATALIWIINQILFKLAADKNETYNML